MIPTRFPSFEQRMYELPEVQAHIAAKRAWLDAHIVYFAAFGGPDGLIKIGYTGNLPKRIIALGAQAPLPVTPLGWCEGGHSEEQRLHRLFRSSRFNGEWFNSTPELMDYIATNARTDPAPLGPSSVELWRLDRERAAAVGRLRASYTEADKAS